jgi:hypothetical protein
MMGELLGSDFIWVWIAALLTMMVYSYLLGDNPLYRLAEHVFIGSSVAYAVVVHSRGPEASVASSPYQR